jgi:hypothetical protein
VQSGLVGDRTCDDGYAVGLGRNLQSVEPVRPAFVEDSLDADLVSHWALANRAGDAEASPQSAFPGASLPAANISPGAEGSSVARWRFGGEQVERDG